MKQNYKYTFCIPVYNEEEILIKNLRLIKSKLVKLVGSKNFEILVVENGSTDSTLQILKTTKIKNLIYISTGKRGHGLAMKKGILNSRGKYVLMSAIDIPFGFTDLNEMIKVEDKFDLIFGSKLHPKSKIYISKNRRLSTKIYNYLLNILFGIKIKDAQGTFFLNKERCIKSVNKCNAIDAFFSAELVIHCTKSNLRLYEVPISMNEHEIRKSKYSIFRDGPIMLLSMLKTFIKYYDLTRPFQIFK